MSLARLLVWILLGLSWTTAEASEPFHPEREALLLVQLRAPELIRTAQRLHLSDVSLQHESRISKAVPQVSVLDTDALAARSLHWLEFRVAPGVLDSLTIHWSQFEVQVGRAWTQPKTQRMSSNFVIGRKVDAGDVVVLHLNWNPDAMAPSDKNWRPSFSLDEPNIPPLGRRLYVSLEELGVVSVIDRESGACVDAIGVGGAPRGLAWDEGQRRLYVAVAQSDALEVVDISEHNRLQHLALGFGDDPTRVLVSSDMQRVAVLAPGHDSVILLSTGSLQQIARIPVGSGPVGIAEDPRTGRLFVSCEVAGRIEVIDPTEGKIIDTFENILSPGEIAFVGEGRLAVGEAGGRTVEILDPGTGSRLNQMELCGPVLGLAPVQRTRRIFVALGLCREVAILHAERELEMGRVVLPGMPGLATLDAEERILIIPLPETQQLLLLRVDRSLDQRLIDTGPGPWMAVAP